MKNKLGLTAILLSLGLSTACTSTDYNADFKVKTNSTASEIKEKKAALKKVIANYGDRNNDGVIYPFEVERLMGDIAEENGVKYFIDLRCFLDKNGKGLETKKETEMFNNYKP